MRQRVVYAGVGVSTDRGTIVRALSPNRRGVSFLVRLSTLRSFRFFLTGTE